MKTYNLLLLDRDGTLTYEEKHYHRDLQALRGYPYAGPLLRELAGKGLVLAVVTNQSGVGRGYWTLAEVEAAHGRLCREWGVAPRFYICPHAPDDGCTCRKPRPDLIEQALADHRVGAQEALMIGDSLADYGAARAAGTDFALVLTGRGSLTMGQLAEPPTLILDTIADMRLTFG